MKLFNKFISSENRKPSAILIPDGSEFKPLTELNGSSINDIGIHLGYNTDQVHIYFGDFKDKIISSAGIEIFTKNIVFILTKNPVTELSKNAVNHFFRNFKILDEFNSNTTQHILEDGIKNKSLRIEFLSHVLHIKNPEPNGLFNISSLGLHLAFSDGYLTDFIPADGLNEWARHWKELNPIFIKNYQKEAEYYWGNNISNVMNEINAQAESYATVPDALQNKFVELHRSNFGNVNFIMLMVCHYNKKVSLAQFIEINHGRFKELNHTFESKKYELGNFIYEFSHEGILLNSYLNK